MTITIQKKLIFALSCVLSLGISTFSFANSADDVPSNDLPKETKALIGKRLYASALPELARLATLERNQSAAFVLANYYQCARVVQFNCKRAVELFHIANQPNNAAIAHPDVAESAKGELAWLNATCTQEGFTGDTLWAFRTANEMAAQSPDPFRLDTLAAAYAALGQYSEALNTQKQALAMLRIAQNREPLPKRIEYTFMQRLERYEQGKKAELTAENAAANCNSLPD